MLHPSDELYGADRVLIEALDVLQSWGPTEVWLPDDLDYPDRPLSRELAARGVPVKLVPMPVLRRENLDPKGVLAAARRWLTTACLLARRRPAMVYLNTSATLAAAPAARLTGARVVLHLHESWRGSDRVLLTPLLWSCHLVVAVSNAALGTLGPHRVPTRVVANGFAEPVPQVDRATLRAEVGARDDEVLVLMASRWNAWKGHAAFLSAWGLTTNDSLRLVVLGSAPLAGRTVDVPALVAGNPRAETIAVVGQTADVAGWIVASDVVVVPSTLPDSLPTIAIEALALGRAVLAADHGGLPEIVTDHLDGLLLPRADQQAWATALDSLERAEVARWGARGRQRYLDSWTGDSFRHRLSKALRDGDSTPRR